MIEPFDVIVPGAGLSTRFSSDTPKQYLKINDQFVIDYSLKLFLSFKECKNIIVAVSKLDTLSDQILKDEKIKIIEGGASRAESVKLSFDWLSSNESSPNTLIHDAARPCLQLNAVKKFLEEFSSSVSTGAIFAVPCGDTLKSSEDGKLINGTVDRSSLWQAQTPQIFKTEQLKQAYMVYEGSFTELTDESSLFDGRKEKISLFKSSQQNLKITFKEDIELAEVILKN